MSYETAVKQANLPATADNVRSAQAAEELNYSLSATPWRGGTDLYSATGMDLRGQEFRPFYVGQLTGASSLHVQDGRLTITIWKPGQGERVVRKD